jgi:hypothetical protein
LWQSWVLVHGSFIDDGVVGGDHINSGRYHALQTQCRPPPPYRQDEVQGNKLGRIRCRRGSLTLWITPEALSSWQAPKRTTRGGQPLYSDLAIETALTLGVVFGLRLRQTEGLLASVLKLMGLDRACRKFSWLTVC